MAKLSENAETKTEDLTGGMRIPGGDVHQLEFPGKRLDEKVEILVRRHWSVLAKHTVMFFVSLVLPLPVFLYLHFELDIDFTTGGVVTILTVLVGSIYYLYAWLLYFHQWIDYYLDVWIVTDQRLLDIEQKGLFSRSISELKITKIQDVTSDVNGKIETFLNYGNIQVQTAGKEQQFEFLGVGQPREIAKRIMQIHDIAEKQEIREHRKEEIKQEKIAEAETKGRKDY